MVSRVATMFENVRGELPPAAWAPSERLYLALSFTGVILVTVEYMGKNAASLLADLFEEWEVPAGKTPEHVRAHSAGAGGDPGMLWVVQERAAKHLFEVERLMAGMRASGEDVSMFEQSRVRWYETVFAYQTPWQSHGGAAREAIAIEHINLLRAFGAMIDAGGTIEVDQDDVRTLQDVLSEAEALVLSESQHMTQDARRYLWSLIAEAQRFLKDLEAFGEAALRRVAFELAGALINQGDHAEARGDHPTARRLKNAATMLVGALGTGFSGGLGGALAQGVTTQITGG